MSLETQIAVESVTQINSPAKDERRRLRLILSITPSEREWTPNMLLVAPPVWMGTAQEASSCEIQEIALHDGYKFSRYSAGIIVGPRRVRLTLSVKPSLQQLEVLYKLHPHTLFDVPSEEQGPDRIDANRIHLSQSQAIRAARRGSDSEVPWNLPTETLALAPDFVPAGHEPPYDTSYQFDAQAQFHVYSQAVENLETPTIEGLNTKFIQAHSRDQLPQCFGSLVLPRNGITEPEPRLIQQLVEAQYVYRIHIVRSNPPNLEYLADAMALASNLASVVNGVIRDCQTGALRSASQLRDCLKATEFNIEDHVVIHAVKETHDDSLWLHTHGLAKFGRADLEVRNVPVGYRIAGAAALLASAEYLSTGEIIAPGQTIQMGPRTLLATRSGDITIEEFPNGLIRLNDFNTKSRTPSPGINAWLAATRGH